MNLYLASGSPRRIQLLKWMGFSFKIAGHEINEDKYRQKDARLMVANLAIAKAGEAAERIKGSGLVIGSDLTVALKDKQYGKPKDEGDARRFLSDLSGKVHTVYCGVAVWEIETGTVLMSVAEAKVKMKNYNKDIIEKYTREFEVLDKGGGYAIQFLLKGYGSLVDSFEGGITTIIGLPLDYLENLLKEFGVKPKNNWREKCKKETGYRK